MKRIISSLVLAFFLFGTLAFNIPPVKANGTIYIRADGSVEGTSYIRTVDNVTYVFVANVNDSIVVERNNIIIDGNGHTLQGGQSGRGIDLAGRTNVTVQNTQIKAFDYGIWLQSSSSNTISGNNITSNYIGIELVSSLSNSIYGNKITANNRHGIFMEDSSNNTLAENNITANKPYGVYLEVSSNNTLVRNNITANILEGVILSVSSNNTFVGNNVVANGRLGGFYVEYSSNNTFYHNNIINNTGQPYFFPSSGYGNRWDNGFEGNYWSDYNGTDSDHDGIGDTPHILNASNRDNYPLMSPYIPGDGNHDGEVNMTDVDMVRQAWQSKKSEVNYNPHVDFNMDGIINIKDAAIIGVNWLKKWENKV